MDLERFRYRGGIVRVDRATGNTDGELVRKLDGYALHDFTTSLIETVLINDDRRLQIKELDGLGEAAARLEGMIFEWREHEQQLVSVSGVPFNSADPGWQCTHCTASLIEHDHYIDEVLFAIHWLNADEARNATSRWSWRKKR